MRFAVLVYPGKDSPYVFGGMPSAEMIEKMGKFNEELVNEGVILAMDGFHPPGKSTRIAFADGGKQTISQGGFAGAPTLGGYWIWEVKSKEEALAWAKRAPMADGETLEIRPLFEAADFGAEVEAQESALLEKIKAKQS